ncbi:C40 family peptidase [Actinokineospora sp. NBRC 105648]|uniref:C40 family peptidase n=1 Tax=Actinokineospora sp. NBRC 105648 TaxID=3032206 RepID=UPI0024A1E845|nr:C40 family peptidase [Actinokineospora sp. NBRC 105648]GLZ37861.1 lipoprotein [Actinokineospora sp. NBRC 105648]
MIKAAALGLAACLALVSLIGGAIDGVAQVLFGDLDSPLGSLTCTGTSLSSRPAGYRPNQLANAATIVAVGKQLNVPELGWVIAIATAMQESTLNNLDHGDRDSLGLFQQRPSQGWGTPAQILNPTYAATQFYRHLLAIPGWQQMTVTDAAQAVQRSATPNAYARHEQAARQVLIAVQNATCTTTTIGTGDCNLVQAPNPIALTAINYACGQRGLPYLWGGNGPQLTELPDGRVHVNGGFDCSGLTKASFAAAGVQLPRTAHTQYQATTRVAEAELAPGDLVFYGNPRTKIHHVGLYIGAGKMIDAPTFGQPVGIHPVRYPGDDFASGGRVTR